MDSIIDKLLEAIKEKMSKKQVVALVAMIVLAIIKPTTTLELAVAIQITVIAIVEISWQGYLDKGENDEKVAGVIPDNSND